LKTCVPLEDAGVREAAVRARGEQGEALVLALQAVATRGDEEVSGWTMMGQRSERWARDAPHVHAEEAGIRRGGDEKGSAHLAVVTNRAPVAPNGWPMASDPPSTLVLAMSIWPTARPVGNRSCANLSDAKAVMFDSTCTATNQWTVDEVLTWCVSRASATGGRVRLRNSMT
jgi:hypothetical protein